MKKRTRLRSRADFLRWIMNQHPMLTNHEAESLVEGIVEKGSPPPRPVSPRSDPQSTPDANRDGGRSGSTVGTA